MLISFLAFILASLISGSNPIFVKLGTSEIPPLTLTFFRVLGAFLILLPVWFSRKEYIRPKDVYKVLPFGVNITLFSIGVQFSSAIMSGILYTIVPILVGIYGYFLIKERLSKNQVIGLFLSLVGVAILMGGSITTYDVLSFGTPLGNSIILLAVFTFGLYPVAVKSLIKSYSQLTILFYGFLVATIFLFPTIFLEWQIRPFILSNVTSLGVFGVIWLIVVSSVLYYYLFQWLIKHISPFASSLTQYGSMVSSGVLGIIFFQEHLTLSLLVGGALVVSGVFLANSYTLLRRWKTPVIQ